MSCNCNFATAEEVLQKVRNKGISNEMMDIEYEINCECGNVHVMDTFESKCQNCDRIYAVTPCSQTDPEKIAVVSPTV